MACRCRTRPCVCPPELAHTKCDLYRPGDKNMWVERGDNPGSENAPGICLLDTWSEEQVINSLQRNEPARQDLLKVTTDARLIELARTVVPFPTQEQVDMEQANLNRAHENVPFYSIFRGQPPFSQ